MTDFEQIAFEYMLGQFQAHAMKGNFACDLECVSRAQQEYLLKRLKSYNALHGVFSEIEERGSCSIHIEWMTAEFGSSSSDESSSI